MGKCPFGDRGACMRSSVGATAKPSTCKGRSYLRWRVSDNAPRNIPPTQQYPSKEAAMATAKTGISLEVKHDDMDKANPD